MKPTLPSLSDVIRVAAVDNHHIALSGIAAWCEADPRFELAGTFVSADELLAAADSGELGRVDVVCQDLYLEGEGIRGALPSVDAVKAVAARWPVLILSMSPNDEDVYDAVNCDPNVRDYLNKDSRPQTVLDALVAVAARREDMSGDLAQVLINEQRRRAASAYVRPFTARQIEVLTLLAQGYSDGEIAKELGIARSTVEKHLRLIRQNVGEPLNRVELAIVAMQHGGVEPPRRVRWVPGAALRRRGER